MPQRGIKVHDPGLYQITVQGTLAEDWADYVSGVSLAVTESDDGTRTVLICPVLDQASLAGILARLHSLGLPLLSVEYLGKQEPPRSPRPRKDGLRPTE